MASRNAVHTKYVTVMFVRAVCTLQIQLQVTTQLHGDFRGKQCIEKA